MKILPGLLSLLLVACVRAAETSAGLSTDVRCELLALDLSTDTAIASFRASNGTGSSVSYRGYSEGGPLYQCEVLDAGVWQASPLGWCGTGLEEHVLDRETVWTSPRSSPRTGAATASASETRP